MKFVLNDLKTTEPYRPLQLPDLTRIIQAKIEDLYKEKYKPIWASTYYPEEEIQESFLYMLSNAYSHHREIIVNPHDLWYMMLIRLAEEINAEPDLYRSLFSRSIEQVDIVIPCEEGKIDVLALIEKLTDLVPSNIEMFIPNFSTSTKQSSLACMAAFCDMVKTYYRYMTFCCGIKSVTIGGTMEDWELFKNNFSYIAAILSKIKPSNIEWLAKIGFALDGITASLENGDPAFIRDIFTQRNVGSGGELEISGWICDFTSTPRGHKIVSFPLMLAVVPYESLDTGNRYTAVFGGFSSMQINGVYTTMYSSMGFQKSNEIIVPKGNNLTAAMFEPTSYATNYLGGNSDNWYLEDAPICEIGFTK